RCARKVLSLIRSATLSATQAADQQFAVPIWFPHFPPDDFATASPQCPPARRDCRRSETVRKDRTGSATCVSESDLRTVETQNRHRLRAPTTASATHNSSPCCRHHATSIKPSRLRTTSESQ